MKPKDSLYFLVIIIAALTLVSLIFPKDGVVISESYAIKFISFQDYLFPKKVEYADISHLVNADTASVSEADTVYTETVVYDSIKKDSVTKIVIDTTRVDGDSMRHTVKRLQFAGKDPSCLYHIFDALQNLKNSNNSIVRILHYGDSQIEGDRITGILRGHLQKEFGGRGLGLFSAYEENSYAIPLKVKYEGNWERHTRYGLPDSMVNHRNYGLMASFSRFTHIPNDTLPIIEELVEASLEFSPKEKWVYKSRSEFNTIRIFAGNNKRPAFVEIYVDDSLVSMQGIDTSRSIKTITWRYKSYISDAKIKFMGQDSPDIYGISLEDSVGVFIDNIPLRGSAGTLFTRMSKSHLKESYQQVQPKLFILEFGVNVVPNLVDSYTYYERRMYKQIIRLKELCPDASVIVIGVSDMSQKSGDYYETFPNIEKIRDAQKNAAFRAGCAFWDMYEAMGGKNSMPSWVFAKPALAQKDFTHFNYRGSKIIGDMFYNAFKYEYNKYLKTKQ